MAGQQSISAAVDASAHDPFRGFKFKVEIAGGEAVGFQSIAGLSQESEVVEYREGGDPTTMRKLPGLTSYDDITLERGLSKSRFLIDWRNQVANGPDLGGSGVGDGVPPPNFRREVTIKLFDKGDPFQRPVATWEVTKAWPSSLETSDLDAGSSDVVIETLVLSHEGWVRK
jgi:phage tail-like protein